jgi:hypothetical protein
MEATLTMDHLYTLTANKARDEIAKILTAYLIVCDNRLGDQIKIPDTTEQQLLVNQVVQELLRQPEYQLC